MKKYALLLILALSQNTNSTGASAVSNRILDCHESFICGSTLVILSVGCLLAIKKKSNVGVLKTFISTNLFACTWFLTSYAYIFLLKGLTKEI